MGKKKRSAAPTQQGNVYSKRAAGHRGNSDLNIYDYGMYDDDDELQLQLEYELDELGCGDDSEPVVYTGSAHEEAHTENGHTEWTDEEDLPGISQENIEWKYEENLPCPSQLLKQRKRILVDEKDLPGMQHHVSVCLDNNILVFGGDTAYGRRIIPGSVIFVLNLDSNKWRMVMPDTTPPWTRNACAVVFGKHVYMFGGVVTHASSKHEFTNAMWKLSRCGPNRFTWREVRCTGQIPSPRRTQSWDFDHKMWTFAGMGPYLEDNRHGEWICADFDGTSSLPQLYYYNQLNCFHPKFREWENVCCQGNIPSPRADYGVTKVKSSIWLCGGSPLEVSLIHDLYNLNMTTLIFTQISVAGTTSPVCRYAHSFTALTDKQIALHGGCSDEGAQSDTWILDLTTLSWKQYDVQQNRKRTMHTAIQSSNEVLVLGGIDMESYGFGRNKCDAFRIRSHFTPKCLEGMALKGLHKYKDILNPKEYNMPSSLYHRFCNM